jgi:hypothetical protein
MYVHIHTHTHGILNPDNNSENTTEFTSLNVVRLWKKVFTELDSDFASDR